MLSLRSGPRAASRGDCGQAMTVERSISASLHGRYLVDVPDGPGPFPLLVAFHGYAEDAATQLERMRGAPQAGPWLIAAIMGLHRFYRRRTREVVASWMTRQDRDQMIADNVTYVSGVVQAISREWPLSRRVVFAGFSQGAAMAYRAACRLERPVDGLIAVGGDVPPELDHDALRRIPCVMIGRGHDDEWYTTDKCASDERRLSVAGVRLEICRFAGGHEWPAEFNRVAGVFLSQLTSAF